MQVDSLKMSYLKAGEAGISKKGSKDEFLDESLLDGVHYGHDGGLWEKKSTKKLWKLKVLATAALIFLTSSQSILTAWSKRAGKYEYCITTSIFMAEALKCAISLGALLRVWSIEGVNDNNKLLTSSNEIAMCAVPIGLYWHKDLQQEYSLNFLDVISLGVLKQIDIMGTGVVYHVFLDRKLSRNQWFCLTMLCGGCVSAQLNPVLDHDIPIPLMGWVMTYVMAWSSGLAGSYTDDILKKSPSRNINVQNFWISIFGMVFNGVIIFFKHFDIVTNKGFFFGYSSITILLILNRALCWIATSFVLKYTSNIVNVYATSVAMILTTMVSSFLYDLHLSIFLLPGSMLVLLAIYHNLHEKLQTRTRGLIC